MHVEADRPFYLGEKRIFEGERQMKKIRFPLRSILSKEVVDCEKWSKKQRNRKKPYQGGLKMRSRGEGKWPN